MILFKKILGCLMIDLRVLDIKVNTTYEQFMIAHKQIRGCKEPNISKPNMEFDL